MQTSQPARPRRKRSRFKLPTWLALIILGAFALVALATAVLTFIVVRDAVSAWQVQPAAPEIALEESAQQAQEAIPQELVAQADQPLQADNRPAGKAWDGISRVNLLLMGLDLRDWEQDMGAPRTDTLILLSLDPVSRTAGMLSIPRDLWVDIPGFEPSKINMAYRLGEVYNVQGGGPGLALSTVEQVLGMEIDYYTQVDFSAFERFIDEIGGVEVDVPEEIEIDPLGDNNNKVLQPGRQVLPGSLALGYARARNTAGSDFDRAQRQQQVIFAIRQRLLDEQLLPGLIKKAPALYGTLAQGIHTNLSLLQLIRMAWVAQQVPAENIRQGVIGPDQVNQTYSFDGQDILVPIPDAIRALRDQIFLPSGPVVPASSQGNPLDLARAEDCRIAVLNGTLNPGLASQTADFLTENGLQAVEPGNAEELYSQTTLIDYTGNPHTVEYLSSLLTIAPTNVYHRYDVSSTSDIVLLLGEDWATNNSMP